MAELGCASPLHPPGTAWHGGMTGVTANPDVCWSKYLGTVQPGPGKHIEILEAGGQ